MANVKAKPKKVPAPFPLMRKVDKKAKDQPHFTILAQDNFVFDVVSLWITMAENHGTPVEKTLEARELLKGIKKWRRENPQLCKVPD